MTVRAIGINRFAFEVHDLDEALEWYQRHFGVTLRGRRPTMAWLDLGDQFIALSEGGAGPPEAARLSSAQAKMSMPWPGSPGSSPNSESSAEPGPDIVFSSAFHSDEEEDVDDEPETVDAGVVGASPGTARALLCRAGEIWGVDQSGLVPLIGLTGMGAPNVEERCTTGSRPAAAETERWC